MVRFAIAYMAAIKLTVAVIHRVVTGAWPAFGSEPVYIMALAVVVSTPVQAGEEIGWRGYALPRLAKGVGLPTASILVGFIWATWHLPLFFIAGIDKTGQSFPVYLLDVTALSVTMAWLDLAHGRKSADDDADARVGEQHDDPRAGGGAGRHRRVRGEHDARRLDQAVVVVGRGDLFSRAHARRARRPVTASSRGEAPPRRSTRRA